MLTCIPIGSGGGTITDLSPDPAWIGEASVACKLSLVDGDSFSDETGGLKGERTTMGRRVEATLGVGADSCTTAARPGTPANAGEPLLPEGMEPACSDGRAANSAADLRAAMAVLDCSKLPLVGNVVLAVAGPRCELRGLDADVAPVNPC